MSNIPRYDRKSSSGGPINLDLTPGSSPKIKSKIPLPVSPRKPTVNAITPSTGSLTTKAPHCDSLQNLEYIDIRDVSTPSHFNDDDSELDALSSIASIDPPDPPRDQESVQRVAELGSDLQTGSEMKTINISPQTTTPTSPPPVGAQLGSINEVPYDDNTTQDSAASTLQHTPSPPLPNYTANIQSPDFMLPPTLHLTQSSPLPLAPPATDSVGIYSPDATLVPLSPPSAFTPFTRDPTHLPTLPQQIGDPLRFVPISDFTIPNSSHWTREYHRTPPMLPPLPSPPSHDPLGYYRLRSSVDSPDLTSMSYGTPMDTPSPIPSLLSTPDGIGIDRPDFDNFPHYAVSEGLTQQLSALREALDESTQERARLVEVIREQELVIKTRNSSNAPVGSAEYNSEMQLLRERCVFLENENHKLISTQNTMDETETRAILQEATRARDMLASEFEHLKAYQLQLEEELRVEKEKNNSPTSPGGNVTQLQFEGVNLENSELRDKLSQQNLQTETEVQRLTLELQELEQSASVRLRENESYFMEQIQQKQITCDRFAQANRQLAQELNEQDSSKRLLHSQLESVQQQKEQTEGDLLSQQNMYAALHQQLMEKQERLSELEMKQGLQVDLEVLNTLKGEIERLKVYKEGVELKLTQEMQQTLQYMEAKKEADKEVDRLRRELQSIAREVNNHGEHALNEALEAANATNQKLTNELEKRRASFESLKENLTRIVAEKRRLETDHSFLDQRAAQLNGFLEQKTQECFNLKRQIENLQADGSVAVDQTKSLEDSKQALSSLISLLSQVISDFASAVAFSQEDHQSFAQEIKFLFDEVSCPGSSEDSSPPRAFDNIRRLIQRQGQQVQQLIGSQSRLDMYSEEVGLLRTRVHKLEGDKVQCETNILELLANNASLQTKVNFNSTHTDISESIALSQILPPDVFTLVNQNPGPLEQGILQSQLELTGQASPLPDTPPDYFNGELRETRRELTETQNLTLKLKQDLVKSHGCIVSLQVASDDIIRNSCSLTRRAEAAEAEIQRMRGEAETSKIERIHSSAGKIDKINCMERILESVHTSISQEDRTFNAEFSKLLRIGDSADQSSTELFNELQQCSDSLSLADTSQLPHIVDTVLRCRQRILSKLINKATEACNLNQQLASLRTELSAAKNETDSGKVKLTELSEQTALSERALSEERSKTVRMEGDLAAEQKGRKLLEDELKDRERIVASLRHQLEQEHFLHQQQSSGRETNLSGQVDELRENNVQLKRDLELLNNRMQHHQITASNQVEQLNAQLCHAETEVTRLQGENTKLGERVKLETDNLAQLSTSQAREIEAITLELTQNKAEVNRCHSELETQRNRLAEKERKLVEIVGDLDELREKKQTLIAQYEVIQENKLAEANQKLDRLEHENRALKEENDKLKNTFETEVPNILEGNKEERTKLQKFIEDLSNKNAQLTQSLSEHKSELLRSKQELSRLTLASEEQFESIMRSKGELENELGRMKQEYASEISALQGEIPLELMSRREEQDHYSMVSENVSLPNMIRKICQENNKLKVRCQDLENSILEGRADSLPGTSTPDLQDHSDIVYFKKPSWQFDVKPNDRVLRTKKKQLELLRLKLGYTLRELRMYKVLKTAYDQQIDDLKRMLSESGDKYEGCLQKIMELEQLCLRDD